MDLGICFCLPLISFCLFIFIYLFLFFCSTILFLFVRIFIYLPTRQVLSSLGNFERDANLTMEKLYLSISNTSNEVKLCIVSAVVIVVIGNIHYYSYIIHYCSFQRNPY